MNVFKPTLFLALIGWPALLVGQDTVSFKLLPQAQVDSAGIYLDQIVASSNTNQVVPHIRLARAPYSGQTASLSRADVLGLAQSSKASITLTNLSGAKEVHIARRMRPFEETDLLELLSESLQRQYVKNQGELELHLTQPWSRPLVPDEPLKLEISDMPRAGVMENFVAGFELWCGKERVGHWQAPLQASIWHEIPIAHSTLQRGDSVVGADVVMERADILAQRDVYMGFPATDDSLEFAETVLPGHPVMNRAVRARPLILRGQMVEGVFQDGPLAISLMVETLEDGALGQTVRVRNPKTNRQLFGKVENEKTIRITL